MTEPRAVSLRIAAAILVVTAMLVLAGFVWPMDDVDPGTGGRLAFAGGLMLVPGLCLAAAIGWVAAVRFASDADRAGAALSAASPALGVPSAVLQNTLEQAVLAGIAYAAAAALWPPERLGAAAVAAALFGIGRLLFALGYARGAAGRAFGFGLTFYPTLVLLAGSVAALAAG